VVFVAGRDAFTVDGALEVLTHYEASFGATVSHYDLGGPDEIEIDDAVSTTDLGRLVLINAGLDGEDGARLLAFDLASRLRGLGVDLRLEEVDQRAPGTDDVYARMDAVWRGLMVLPNIIEAKVSKLLHLKRPKLFPIIDSRIQEIYRSAAEQSGRSLGWTVRHYWSAIAADVRANQSAFTEIRHQLMDASSTSRRLVYLSDLRMQDILAWGPTAG
jgi:Family of unknown function (DUF6308)